MIYADYCVAGFDKLKKNDILKSSLNAGSRIKVIESRLFDFWYGNPFKARVGASLLSPKSKRG